MLYWRDLDGPEVDWVLQNPDVLVPIEVKLTDRPSLSDAKHLKAFLGEYQKAEVGYIVCQIPRKMQLSDNIFAISWQELESIEL